MRALGVVSMAFWIFSGEALASPVCFQFQTSDTPEAAPLDGNESSQRHVWCYENVVSGGKKLVFAYPAADAGEVDPALSALSEYDENGVLQEVAHGSRVKGEVEFVKSDIRGFNPLARPLDAIEAAFIGEPLTVAMSTENQTKLSQTFAQLERALHRPMVQYRIEAGTFEKALDATRLPYGGYWWPQSGVTLAGPLEKYDRIVTAWTGTNPQATAWERANHASRLGWGGHCNGWAASSVLDSEVAEPRVDAATGITLNTTDFNGMLAEAGFCVDWAFFGKRYNGAPSDDILDISPVRFHEVISHYIGRANKPVAVDYYADESVDNHVMTGYKFVITPIADQAGRFNVRAEIRTHAYDSGRYERVGPAREYVRTYRYILSTDGAGNVTGGEWQSDNPDFLWVPLAQKNCGRENPRIDPALIARMMNLPRSN